MRHIFFLWNTISTRTMCTFHDCQGAAQWIRAAVFLFLLIFAKSQ